MATSRCSARSPPAPRSSPAARSTSTARLRGRAFAGSHGNERARIFCNKVEAELLAISGFYRTADDIEARLRSQPIQAWLKGDVMFIAPLN